MSSYHAPILPQLKTNHHTAWLRVAAIILAVVIANGGHLVGQEERPIEAQWVWNSLHSQGRVPQTAAHFRKAFDGDDAKSGKIRVWADDTYEIFLNGRQIGNGTGWERPTEYDITKVVRPGTNIIAVRVVNTQGGHAGLAVRVRITRTDGLIEDYSTDSTWLTHPRPFAFWTQPRYSDRRWQNVEVLGDLNQTEPWISVPTRNTVAETDTPEAEPTPPTAAPEQTADVGDDETPESSADTDVSQNAPEASTAQAIFRVKSNFEVQILANHADTGSLIGMEFNEFGELLLSKENGPLLLMSDRDDNGIPDTIKVYCKEVKNCQGILPLNGDVFVTADGPDGAALYRLTPNLEFPGTLKIKETLIKFGESMGEHGPHAVALGPDGMIYVVVGNHTELSKEISEKSPYHDYYEGDIVPRFEDPGGHSVGVSAPGGTVLRTNLEGTKVELVAGGLRNAYDLAFDSSGNLMTHDSDMEADQGGLWYRPTKIAHIVPGGEYGWRSGWAKWPDYWHDGLPPVTTTGRGSPTGTTFYDHFVYPSSYHGNMFVCDWTNGKISTVAMKEEGAGYTATTKTFLEGKPLSVADVTVGPDGWLYFITGGRGTAGGVYRVIYKGEVPKFEKKIGTGVAAAIRYPQMQSAWARQKIAKIKQAEPEHWRQIVPAVARTKKNSTKFRTRALDMLRLFGPPPTSEFLIELSQDEDAAVRAKVADLMGGGKASVYGERLTEMLSDEDAQVRRHVCEAIVRNGTQPSPEELSTLLISTDRWEANAARRVLEQIPTPEWKESTFTTKNHRLFIQRGTALLIVEPTKKNAMAITDRFQELLSNFISDDDFIDMLRLTQLAVHRGELEAEDMPKLQTELAAEFPSGNQKINRELLRLLAALDVGDINERYVDYLQTDLPAEEKLHVALQLGLIENGWTGEQKLAVLSAFEETLEEDNGHSVDGYVRNVSRNFAANLTEVEQQQVLKNAYKMRNAALAVLFQLPEQPGKDVMALLRDLDKQLADEDGEAAEQLKLGIIAVCGQAGDDESMAYLRSIYSRNPDHRPYIAMALSLNPEGKNWPYLVDSIPTLDRGGSMMVMGSLTNVNVAPKEPEPYRQVILRGLLGDSETANSSISLLQHWTGTSPAADDQPAEEQIAAWQTWFAERWPNHPPAVVPDDSKSKWDFEDLLQHITQATGDGPAEAATLARGAAVFKKGQCSKCHRFGNTGESVGPDLTAVSKRFRKRELLESIVYPSHVISDQYRSKTVLTVKGKSYTGIVASGAPGEVVVLTTEGSKVVLKEKDVDEVTPSKLSAMPEGLLNNLTLEEVTDLFLFLDAQPSSRLSSRPEGNSSQ